jgi:hypothetical protein
MIEKTYGEAIYGYDFWSAALNESPYVLWLQKENSEEKLQLDIFNNINFGLPKVKIGVDQVIGLAGGVYSGLPTIENREFSFKTFFAGNDYKTALNAERIDYILNWFEYNKYEKMYLYWFVKDRLKTYRIEVRPSISGEQYNKYIIAKDVGISLIAEKPYFEAVEETEISETLQTTEENIETIVYGDWFLPSKDELDLVYQNLKLQSVGNFSNITSTNQLEFWTSTQWNAYNSYAMNFYSGECTYHDNQMGYLPPYYYRAIRAVRSFVSATIYALRDVGQAGGWIFHIIDNLDGTFTYYECAPENQSNKTRWCDYLGTLDVVAPSASVGAGKTNTQAILAYKPTAEAAGFCADYENSVEETKITPKTGDHIISILNNGLDTPFILEITPLESTPYLKVINDRGAGFESYYSFPANKKIVIDTATGIVTLDGTVMNSFFSSGSLFNLARGINRIYINLINCDFAIRFRERVK